MEITKQVLDYGYVRYIEHYGSDERIIESARMSTDGNFRGWESDARLLRYLWVNGHLTPFEMCGLTVEVQTPIFVCREWQRHRTQSYNELSARYTELPNLYYIPSIERLMAGKQAEKNKQSSEVGFTEDAARHFQQKIQEATAEARHTYDELLKWGVAREIARSVIPLNQYTRYRASCNLRNWLHFLQLRMDAAAQWEIRQFANAVGEVIEQLFPRTYALFKEGQNA